MNSPLPIFQTAIQELHLMQTRWASLINPLLRRPLNSSVQSDPILLSIGDNIINHRLGRKPQGWIIIDVDGDAQIYRSAPFNDKTLTLNSDAAVTIQLIVF